MYNSHKGVYFMKLYKRVLTVVAAASLLGAALCGCGGQNAGGASQPADSSSSDAGSSSSPASSQAGSVGKADDVSIKKGEWTDIEWETYVDQTGFFSLEMPKGWKIDVTDMYGAGRVAGLQINVCNPEDTVGTDMVDFGTAAIADMTDATVESLFRDALYKSLPNFTIKESKTAEWQQHFIDDNPDVVLDAKVIRADYTDKTKGDDREVMCQAVLEKGLLDGYYGYVTAYAAYSVRGELDNWIDTLARIQTSFKVTDAYLCDDYHGFTPQDGNVLLVVKIDIENTMNSSIPMSDLDFQAQWGDDADDAFAWPITSDPETMDDRGTLCDEQLPYEYEMSVGEKISGGELVYEVPEGYKDFSISAIDDFADETEDGDVYFVYFTAGYM